MTDILTAIGALVVVVVMGAIVAAGVAFLLPVEWPEDDL